MLITRECDYAVRALMALSTVYPSMKSVRKKPFLQHLHTKS